MSGHTEVFSPQKELKTQEEIIANLREEISELRMGLITLKDEAVELKKKQNEMVGIINKVTGWINNLPNNQALLALITQNCITYYDDIVKAMENRDGFSFKLEWLSDETTAPATALRVDIHDTEVNVSQKRHGEWEIIVPTSDGMIAFNKWIGDSAKAAGLGDGTHYVVPSYKNETGVDPYEHLEEAKDKATVVH